MATTLFLPERFIASVPDRLTWIPGGAPAGTTVRHDSAYALYVDAIAAPADADGRKQRDADLIQAASLIAGASPEAQKLDALRFRADRQGALDHPRLNARARRQRIRCGTPDAIPVTHCCRRIGGCSTATSLP